MRHQMQIRRLTIGQEEAACQVVQRVKLVIDEMPGCTVDPAHIRLMYLHEIGVLDEYRRRGIG
jgi:hypothetical protein